ncbi:DUF1876 domain-containing protein [Streptacidiphilus sp. EB129]|uniref:DUF1876 domain-containing protein n=1 Tax=Streptacidiphilus sp. EB129 TaxID=3156262 RepID=UPI00351724A8
MEAKEWNVRVQIIEDGGDTTARAMLTTGENSTLVGRGVARRNPVDRPVAVIGDELAASRALEDLATKLHDVASHDFAYLAGPVQHAFQ